MVGTNGVRYVSLVLDYLRTNVELFWKILVTFSEKRQKKGGWFVYSGGEEDVPWEQWCPSFF